MILGMSIATFTLVHVVLSLVGIAAGLVASFGMLSAKRLPGWTAIFLATTVLTSVTGFFLPATQVTPGQIVGGISLVALASGLLALYVKHLGGAWRWIYVTCVVLALYLNVFVAVVQSFQKLPFLRPLAPTQSEPPFVVAQVVVMVLFVALGWLAVRRFHPATPASR